MYFSHPHFVSTLLFTARFRAQINTTPLSTTNYAMDLHIFIINNQLHGLKELLEFSGMLESFSEEFDGLISDYNLGLKMEDQFKESLREFVKRMCTAANYTPLVRWEWDQPNNWYILFVKGVQMGYFDNYEYQKTSRIIKAILS